MSLDALFKPSSVCLVGASGNPDRLAGRPLLRLAQHRYPGRVTVVNPKYTELGGYPCYPTVADIGEPADVALVTLPARAVPEALRECGAAGIRYAVVVSSGFEDDRRSGDLGRELRAAVQESKIRLVGPNCEGLWSIPEQLTLTFGSAAARDRLVDGPVSVISQSGSIGGACMRMLQDAGVGCRFFVSTGNETDLTTLDYLEYMIAEGGSRVVALFLEALTDGRRLPTIAAQARARGVALVALRAGGSEAGRRATESHTGRVASAARVYRDVLRRSGILEVSTLTELVRAADVAARFAPVAAPAPSVPPGSGVGVIAISGGSRALIADSCERHDVPLATFTTTTQERLDAILPEFGYAANPTDVTGAVLDDPDLFTRVLDVVAADPATDALLVQYANGAGTQVERHLQLYARLAGRSPKPVVMSFLGAPGPAIDLRSLPPNVTAAADPDQAVTALGWLRRLRARPIEASPGTGWARADGWPSDLSNWADRMALLDAAGIPYAPWEICPSEPAPHDTGLRYPLVVKALPETGEHKTERGLVLLGVDGRDARDEAIRLLRRRAGGEVPVLLQEQVGDAFEALLSVRVDPDFGPVLAIGLGGVLTEWTNDITYLPASASERAIRDALADLRCWELLQGYRGGPRRDVGALAAAAAALGAGFPRYADAGWEIELNPLMTRADGDGVVAVDVLCSRRGDPGWE